MSHRQLRVGIDGYGIATLMAARVLAARGYDVVFAKPRDVKEQVGSRVLVLPGPSCELIAALCDVGIEDLPRDGEISVRQVNWSGDQISALPAPGLVIEHGAICEWLARRLEREPRVSQSESEAMDSDVRLIASPRSDTAAERYNLGKRKGRFVTVTGINAGPLGESAMCIEALDCGWLFAVPFRGDLVVLCIAPAANMLPADSEGVLDWITRMRCLSFDSAKVEAVASIGPVVTIAASRSRAFTYDRQLLIGEAAISLDPLCGDGTGNAARMAILAQAVISAVARGETEQLCFAHYRTRLAAVFAVHTERCLLHYERARHSSIWSDEIEAMRTATPVDAQALGRPIFTLQGLDLIRA